MEQYAGLQYPYPRVEGSVSFPRSRGRRSTYSFSTLPRVKVLVTAYRQHCRGQSDHGATFQYPTTGRRFCVPVDYRGDMARSMAFQYPTTGRRFCVSIGGPVAASRSIELSVPYHGSKVLCLELPTDLSLSRRLSVPYHGSKGLCPLRSVRGSILSGIRLLSVPYHGSMGLCHAAHPGRCALDPAIFQYPTPTGRRVCDSRISIPSLDTPRALFQYPTTGRWVCDRGVETWDIDTNIPFSTLPRVAGSVTSSVCTIPALALAAFSTLPRVAGSVTAPDAHQGAALE